MKLKKSDLMLSLEKCSNLDIKLFVLFPSSSLDGTLLPKNMASLELFMHTQREIELSQNMENSTHIENLMKIEQSTGEYDFLLKVILVVCIATHKSFVHDNNLCYINKTTQSCLVCEPQH